MSSGTERPRNRGSIFDRRKKILLRIVYGIQSGSLAHEAPCLMEALSPLVTRPDRKFQINALLQTRSSLHKIFSRIELFV
jgi:hypothetical protein